MKKTSKKIKDEDYEINEEDEEYADICETPLNNNKTFPRAPNMSFV